MSMHWACYGTGVAHDERLGCRHADHGPCGGKCPRCDECDGTGKMARLAVRYTLDSEREMPAGSVLTARINSLQIDADGALHIAIQVDGVATPRERSAMKVIKRGTPPEDVELQLGCPRCGSELQFKKSEIKTATTPHQYAKGDDWHYVTCEVCSAKIDADKATPAAT